MSEPQSSPHPSYRPDIDGLRAIAVLAVVLFHTFPARLPGGFLGVDLFFVISGFVITRQIRNELSDQRFTLVTFYARRARRIFPALALTLLLTTAVGAVLLFRSEFSSLTQVLWSSLLFLPNLQLWRVVDYFGPAAETQPLLHLWSLGVEEQFYFVWPLVLAAAMRRKRTWLIAAGLAAASWSAAVLTSGHDPAAAFYLPQFRAWELLAGAIPALVAQEAAPAVGGASAGWTAGANLTALVILALALCGLRSTTDALTAWKLVPVLAAAWLMLSTPTGPARALLSAPPVRFLGRISYPLYLVHWPILAFWNIHFGAPDRNHRLLGIALSVALASVVHITVETPIRRQRATPRLALGLLVPMLGIGMWAAIVNIQQLGRDDPRESFLARATAVDASSQLFQRNHYECSTIDNVHNTERPTLAADCLPAGQRGGVLLWGDSHAQQLRHALESVLPPHTAIAQLTTFGCAPAWVPAGKTHLSACERSNRLLAEATARIHPDLVVLAQRDQHLQTDWPALTRALKAEGAREVVLIGPVPQWIQPLPRLLAQEFPNITSQRRSASLDRHLIEIDRALKATLGTGQDPRYFSMMDALCDPSGCLTHLALEPAPVLTSLDYGHLTLPAAELALHDFCGRTQALPCTAQGN